MAELEASEIERKQVEETVVNNRRPWLFVAYLFLLLCIFLWLDEILDLPHLLLGAPPTPINWREALAETILTAIVGFLAVSGLIRHVTQRERAESQRDASLEALRAAHDGLEIQVEKRTAELRASEERYRSLFENSICGVVLQEIVTDAEGQPVDYTFLEVNQAFTELLDLKADEIIGKRVTEVLLGIEDTSYIEICGQVALTGEPVHFDQFSAPLNKHYAIAAFSPGQGQLATIFVDITERKESEEALRESEEQFRRLFQHSNDAIFIHTLDGRILDANEVACQMMGYSRDQLLSMSVQALHPDDDGPGAEKAITATRETATARFETRFRKADGTIIHVDISSRVTDPEKGTVQGIVRDITDRKRAEEGRQRIRVQLLQAQKMETVGQLAAGIAHDFNNLLTSINGFAELIQSELLPDDPTHNMAGDILRAGQRAAYLVSQLLGFAGKQMIAPQILNPNNIMTGMDQLLRQVIGDDIQLTVILAPDLWPVNLDPKQFRQVILDLAVNARDAVADGGRMVVETANVTLGEEQIGERPEVTEGDYVLLAVSDTGSGMSEEAKERIFEPFFFTSQSVADGVGLRMAAVYGIVKQNRGYIWVQSEAGQGTTFKIYLPRATETE